MAKAELIFLSDLHLAWEKPGITARFIHFLQNRARQARALYILGDLFDAWIGDDDITQPARGIRQHLTQLIASGTQVYLLQGNRDFLLGARFAAATGVQLLDEFTVIDIFGTPTLLTHGDLLCTDDVVYQAFREKSHTQQWQQNVLSKPLIIRLLAARWYRLQSHLHKRSTSYTVMDVNQDAVVDVMRRYQCWRLIHGHTHRPDVHCFEINEQFAQRFVLAEWHKNAAHILCWNSTGYTIEVV
jgi:UDP-2,3-diacylglucosamine hydrolase